MPDESRPNHVTERMAEQMARHLASRLASTADAIDDATKIVAAELKHEQHRLAKVAKQLAQWSADARRDAGRLRRQLST